MGLFEQGASAPPERRGFVDEPTRRRRRFERAADVAAVSFLVGAALAGLLCWYAV